MKLSQAARDRNTKMYDLYHEVYQWEDGWDEGNQLKNFHLLTHIENLTGIPLNGARCLDVGCGTGDLSLFLRKRGITSYLGVDVYKTSIEKATKKYPDEQFLYGDFLATEIPAVFDYAFCSGALTIKLPDADNYVFLSEVLEKMWSLTRVGIACNFLTDDDTDPDSGLFFYNVEKVRAICSSFAPDAVWETIASRDHAQSHVYLYRNDALLTE